MNDLARATRAFQIPHTRRTLLLGLPLLAVTLVLGWVTGSREWFLVRATFLWLVGIVALVRWQLMPLLRFLRQPRRDDPLARIAQHPLGALLLGIVAVTPLAAIVPFLPTRRAGLDLPAGEWQVAGLVAVVLGGMTGLSIWEATIGKMVRRRDRSSRRRMTPSSAV